MPGKTAINWTELSWGVFKGCTRIAPECVNCYAELLAGTRLKHLPAYQELTVIRGDGRPHWTGKIHFDESLLAWPARQTTPALIFTNSMSDPFHNNVTREMRDKFFAAMLIGNQHIYQVLTKRPAEMAAYLNDPETPGRVFAQARALWAANFAKPTKKKPAGNPYPEARDVWPLPHVWPGCSAGSQASADKYIPQLLRIPNGWQVWVSAEPLIARLDLRPEWLDGTAPTGNRVAWVVVGGESGGKHDARPMRQEWAEAIRQACALTGTAYWMKQPGNWREMSEYDRGRYLADTELTQAAAVTGDVCALDPNGLTVRGVKVASETLRGGTPLFWYEKEKHGESPYRAFPAFPASFARGPELTALHPNVAAPLEPVAVAV